MFANLSALPEDLLFAIFTKLGFLTLMRMRQTSSQMAAVVHNLGHGLRKFNEWIELEILILLDVNDESSKTMVKTISTTLLQVRITFCVTFKGTTTVLTDPVAQLSATAIGKTKISFEGWPFDSDENEPDIKEIQQDLVGIFEELRLIPLMLKFVGCPQNFIESILDVLPAPTELCVMDCPKNFNYSGFSQFLAVQNSKNVRIKTRFTANYEEFKNFDSVRVNYIAPDDLEFIKAFIQTISVHPYLSRLRRAEFNLSPSEYSYVSSSFLPSENRFPFARFEDFHNLTRKCIENSHIHIIECKKKWIAIAERRNDFISMMWCEKSPPALLKTLAELIFNTKLIDVDVAAFEDEFTDENDWKERAKIFQKVLTHILIEGEKKRRKIILREVERLENTEWMVY